jgi:hypothetical protein
MPAFRLAALIACLLTTATSAFAETSDDVITRWYAMLLAVNEDGLAKILSDKVIIKLEDVGISQNKAEFLGTMGEWRIAIAGGGIRHKVEKTDGDVTTVRACYDFADNDILMRETFQIDNGQIAANTQTQIAEDCDAY